MCLCNKDWLIYDWILGASWTELSHVDKDHICNALLRMGLKLSLIRLGSLVTSWWTMVHITKELLIMQPYTLIMVTLFTINKVWKRQTGMGQFQCRYCFMFQMKNVKMFMRLLTQASIIYTYTTEMQVATFDVAEKSTFHSHHDICHHKFQLYSPRVPDFFKCNTENSAF